MNMSKMAFISASCLIIGVTTLSAPSFAADAPTRKPAVSQPGASGKAAPIDDQVECPMGNRMGGMMGGQTGGMMGGHMGGMKCDHMGGMKCDHKGGMMGGHMGGMMGGMMGGHGAGMMGAPHMHMIMSLDLNDDQRSKINKLSDELRHNHWATKGLIMDESAKLRDLYAADKRDPSAIGKEYQKIFDLQRQMIEATITTQNRVEELLTPEQRTQLKNLHHKGAPMDKCPMR